MAIFSETTHIPIDFRHINLSMSNSGVGTPPTRLKGKHATAASSSVLLRAPNQLSLEKY